MIFRAVGVNTNKEYAVAKYKAQLMRELALIYPSFRYSWKMDGTYTKQAITPILPEPIRIVRSVNG
ncbi:hypothetical protein [Lentilactobacillus hilgardii]|uniref:hypothetical protein n=1 Tax=Lentilactobacillus hilgardii TaxID=1588 RepID=UPI0021A583CA|nr:hypothetical protein [Lentilactobacillus hilgardii]MCT3390358.1 hypothetical protein [Lentilactobacillus hilgardii]